MDTTTLATSIQATPDSARADADAALLAQHADTFGKIDALEVAMMKLPGADLPVEHRFVPGMYIRTIFMPAGTLLTSKIHRTQHPFVITKGKVEVFDDDNGGVTLEAPHMGITQPGTRRVLKIIEDTVWTTLHATPKTDLAEIEAELIIKHDAHRAGLTQPAATAALEGAAS